MAPHSMNSFNGHEAKQAGELSVANCDFRLLQIATPVAKNYLSRISR